jgi:hypothetical protein
MWDPHLGVSGFGTSGFQIPYTNTLQLLNCENVKGKWDQHFRVSGFRTSGFQIPNTNTLQLPNCENGKGKRDQHFGVSGFENFRIPNTKHQHTTTPELRKCERKVGPTLQGFRGSELWDSKYQTPTHYNSRIAKMRKESGTNTSGFRGSELRYSKYQTPTHYNSRIVKMRKESGTNTSGFWGSEDFGVCTNKRTPHNLNQKIQKSGKRKHEQSFTNSVILFPALFIQLD